MSILPVILGLLPVDAPQLAPTLDLMMDSNHLWSPFGLCSLSKSDEFYGKGENYWKGPIWIPINYLTLQSMHEVRLFNSGSGSNADFSFPQKYMREAGPQQEKARDLYSRLRDGLVSNMFKVWQETGAVWEQYNCETGRGQRTKAFTGWSSIITLIMAERF